MKGILTTLLLFFTLFSFTQSEYKVLIQDQFNGGVCYSGFDITLGNTTQFTSNIHIEPGSTIRKAFLFYGTYFYDNVPIDSSIIININNQSIELDTFSPITQTEMFGGGSWLNYNSYQYDITNIINPNDTQLNFEIEEQQSGTFPHYTMFYIYILYENPNLPLINSIFYVNNEKTWVPMQYNLNQHNKMDTTEPISLSLLTSSNCGLWDGYNIYVNNDSIGLIGGPDPHNPFTYCSATSGLFYHQNNTITGLYEDTPDIWMDSTDALANIQPYITNPEQFNLRYQYHAGIAPNGIQFQDFPEGLTNSIWSMIVTYKPDCDATPLNVTFTDTTICKGESINLLATGGTRYIWEPSTYLSDATIANPICTAEQPTWYTCTMYTADSCSKTIPVFVDVNEPPTLATNTTADTCGYTTGTITALAEGVLPLTYSLDGDAPQNNSNFNNLDGGNYTITVTDGNTCSTSESAVIENINITQAQFTATPTIGTAPTEVEFINESTDATNYTWYITDSVYTSLNANFTFADTGLYTITLVAYNNTPNCADTTYGNIQIVPPLYINIPNVITPNYDQINDVFSIDIEGALAVKCQILNRWGNVLLTYQQDVTPQMQTLNIWDAVTTDNTIYTDGTYFYVINVITPTKIREDYTGIIQVFGE